MMIIKESNYKLLKCKYSNLNFDFKLQFFFNFKSNQNIMFHKNKTNESKYIIYTTMKN